MMSFSQIIEPVVNRKQPAFSDILDAPAERLIAQSRFGVCLITLLVALLLPGQPTQYATVASLILMAYTIVAAGLLGLTYLRFVAPTTQRPLHRYRNYLDLTVPHAGGHKPVPRFVYFCLSGSRLPALELASSPCYGSRFRTSAPCGKYHLGSDSQPGRDRQRLDHRIDRSQSVLIGYWRISRLCHRLTRGKPGAN
jgi:hypothetical protein